MTVGSQEVKNAFLMRVVSVLLIVFSVAELVVGGSLYRFLVNVHLGSWWAAVCTLISGFLGCMAVNRSIMISTCAFSIVGLIVAVVGAVIDCIAASVFDEEIGCVNTQTNQEYGTSKGVYYADECAINYILSSNQDDTYNPPIADDASTFQWNSSYGHYNWNHNYNYYYNHPYNNPYINQTHSFFYYYLRNHPGTDDYYSYGDDDGDDDCNYNNFYYNHPYYFQNHYGFYQPHQCVCSDGNTCYGYELTTGQDCGSILTTYTSLLTASTALLSVLCLLSFALLVLTGWNLCCSSSSSSSASSFKVAGTSDDPIEVEMGQKQVPVYMVAPMEVQEGGGVPPGATVVMMMVPNNRNGGGGSGGASVQSSRRRLSQLPTVMED